MSFRRLSLVFLLLALTGAGCAVDKHYRVGREAEERGDSSLAYDAYCRSGAASRSGAVAAALERTAPGAADEAESAAITAMDQGRYDEAWRLLMRVLDIMPNHPNAPELIRRIEAEHCDKIALVSADYLRRGSAALVMGAEKQAAPSSAIAARPSRPAPVKPATVAAAPRKAPPPTQGALAAGGRVAGSETGRNFEPPRPKASGKKPGEKSGDGRDAGAVASAEKTTSESPREMTPVAPAKPVRRIESPRGVIKPPPKDSMEAERWADDRGEFLIVHTLSKRDRRYPRVLKTLEGITLELKDTDGDGEVDLDVFDGKRRIKKVRDLMPGASQTYRGKSGEVYRLTLLGVHHKSHTVRVGIKAM
ncbi:hypothetical protein B7486_00925 [cyanobacterium TDX16]|nr:hypothetical protein B7486_00925 [cyanobacterium TDX16]